MDKTTSLLVITLLLAGMTPAKMPTSSAHVAAITLTVDMTAASDGLACQVCSAAANDCSLRGAGSGTNDAPFTDHTIIVPSGTHTLTLNGAGEDANALGGVDIRFCTLTISGARASDTIIDGNQRDRALHVHRGASVEINGVTLTNGRTLDGRTSPA